MLTNQYTEMPIEVASESVESINLEKSINHNLIRRVLQYWKTRKELPEEFYKLIVVSIPLSTVITFRSKCGSWMVVYGALFDNEYKTIFLHTESRGKRISRHLVVDMEKEN